MDFYAKNKSEEDKIMKFQNLFLLIAVAGIAYFYIQYMYSQTPFAERPNTPIQRFSFTDTVGKKHYIQDHEGKTIILNFWATWCAPCVQEFPRLVELAERNQKRVVLIALSSDRDDETIQKFIASEPNKPRSANFYVARDTENITGKIFQTYKLPETLIIDRNLNLRRKFIGADWTVEDIEKAISRL